MAAAAAAALLDELMGRNRNVLPNEKPKELNWEDPEVMSRRPMLKTDVHKTLFSAENFLKAALILYLDKNLFLFAVSNQV